MPPRPRSTGALLTLLIILLAASAPAAAQRTPRPKRIRLAEHKRGYTVYTPPGLQEGKRYPALIWLHPAGSTMSTRFRRDWWPELSKRKFFMVLAEPADRKSWSGTDAPYLLDLATDLPKQFAVDARKLVLFGHEAGGLMGFRITNRHYRPFASLITMAAYPVIKREKLELSLPPRRASRRLSILMIVGTDDGGRRFCRQARERLEMERFAVGLVEVPDAGQEYMPEAKPQVLTWLESVAAGKRPTIELPETERKARQALAQRSKTMLAEILKTPTEALPEPTLDVKLEQAGLALRMPTGWKVLADEPASGRLTTAVAPTEPLLVELQIRKHKKGLDDAIRIHELRNRTRGIRYATVDSGKLTLDAKNWTLQQATSLSYHRLLDPAGRTRIVDVPSMITVCYLPLDEKGTEYVRVVFLYTDQTAAKADLPTLVRTVLPTVSVLPKNSKEEP